MNPKSTPANELETTLAERGAAYGAFWENAPHAQRIYEAITDPEIFKSSGEPSYDACLNYAVWMFATKLSRIAQSPTHRDSILDLQGYARCLLESRDHFFPEDE